MHGAEAEADRSDAGQHSARHRASVSPSTRSERYTINRTADTRTVAIREKRIASCLMPARELYRKDARPAETQARAFGTVFTCRLLESGADCRMRLLLRVDVESRRARLRDQQRTAAVARKPDVVALVRAAFLAQLLEQMQELAGRVARQQRPHQGARRGTEQVELSFERRAQAGDAEALRRATAGLSR